MNDESDHTELVAQFVGVTGADADFASSFLEAADWNLNNALNMYLGGGGEQAANLANQRPQVRQTTPPRNPQQQRQAEARQDRLMARARNIMEEQGVDELTAMAIAEAQGEPEEQVRAPIAPTTARLIDDRGPFAEFERESMMMEQRMRNMMQGFGGGIHSTFRDDVFNSVFRPLRNGVPFQDVSDEEDDIEMADERPETANLQDLFSPPREIMFRGDWQQAKDFGKNIDRWILVNIQKDSEFLSYNLNRDLWCNEIVRELIESSFIFFQHEASDRDAMTYIQYYHPEKYPHVAIVDPFTGEQVLTIDLSRFQANPDDLLTSFLERINTFLENNKLEGEKIKRMQEKIQERYKRNDEARHRNRATNSQPITQHVEMDLDDDVQVLDEMELLEDEPEAGPDVTNISFKLFGKKNIRRRFKKTQKVKDLFTFVKNEVEDARTKDFDLVCFPNKSLKGLENETLLEQRLVNTALSAVFL